MKAYPIPAVGNVDHKTCASHKITAENHRHCYDREIYEPVAPHLFLPTDRNLAEPPVLPFPLARWKVMSQARNARTSSPTSVAEATLSNNTANVRPAIVMARKGAGAEGLFIRHAIGIRG